jgi:membrane protease YdiL (CAAX protease family)
MEIKAYPGIKGALVLCLLFVGIQFVLGIIIGVIIGLLGIGTASIFYGLAVIVSQLVSFCVVILIGIKKAKKRFNEIFKFNKVSLRLWLATIIFSLGITVVLSEIDNIFNYLLPMPEFLRNTFALLMVEQMFIISIILVCVIPALMEEMLFRGIMLNGFSENYSERKAIIISSLLFGLVHLNPWQFISAFIIGIFSAWICIKTRSILPSIYMHGFNNVLAVLALKYREAIPIKGMNSYLSPEIEFMPKWLDAAGIAFFIAGILLLNSEIKKAENNAPRD